MNPWRRTRDEIAGAWRSLRYDFPGRREPAEEEPAAEVTTTGMSTFGGALDEGLSTGYPLTRPPRRTTAVAAFGVLAVAGATGSYFAVVNGLGPLLADRPAAAPYAAAAATPEQAGSRAGLGNGSDSAGGSAGGSGTDTGTGRSVAGGGAVVPPRPVATTTTAAPAGAAPRPATGAKKHPAPPVPTPTEPPSHKPSPSPSATLPTTPSDDWTFGPEDRGDWPEDVYPWDNRPDFPFLRSHRHR